MNDPAPLTIQIGRVLKNNRREVFLKRGTDLLHSDTLQLSSAAARTRFLKACATAVPALEPAQLDELAASLLKLLQSESQLIDEERGHAGVTAEQLRKVAAGQESTQESEEWPDLPPEAAIQSHLEFIEAFLKDNALEAQPVRDDSHGGKVWPLRDCPFGGHTGDYEAYVGVTAKGAFYAKCSKDSCKLPDNANRWGELKARNAKWFSNHSPAGSNNGSSDDNLTTMIVHLVEKSGAELFHDPKQVPYATITFEGHKETHRIGSTSFRRWVGLMAYWIFKGVPAPDALGSAIAALEAKACIDGPEIPVFLRVAQKGDSIYLDLGQPDWGTVEINKDGWNASNASNASVPKFRRAAGMAPLPTPVRGGSLQALRRFVNGSDADWPLVLAWLVAAIRPVGPYPIMGLSGEHGTAKSTKARVVRKLIDPSEAPVRSKPREARDLMIAANSAHLLAFDNVSDLPDWLSDLLCMLATGGGYATRKLYTDEDEAIFNAQRPVITTSIEDILGRPDLSDRTLAFALPVIEDKDRLDEQTFWAEFERERPAILGALLDAVVVGLRRIDSIRLPSMPRMADFARWAVACEPGLGLPEGSFLAAYAANRSAVVEIALETNPVAQAVRQLLGVDGGRTIGTCSGLLGRMQEYFKDDRHPPAGFPKSAKALSTALKRITPDLRSQGIRVTRERDPKTRARLVVITEGPGTSVRCVRSVRDPDNRDPSSASEGSEPERIPPEERTDPVDSGTGPSAASGPPAGPDAAANDANAPNASAPSQDPAPRNADALAPDEVDAIFAKVDRNTGGRRGGR